MRKCLLSCLPFLISAALGAAPAASWAAPLATGTATAECDVNPTGLCCGTLTFDNADYDAFGTLVNFGTSAGQATSTSIPTVLDNQTGTGTWAGSFLSYPSPSVLTFNASGSYICPTPDCSTSPAATSWVGSATAVTGSLGLPANVTYALDGTLYYLGVAPPSTPSCPLALTAISTGPFAFNGFQPVATPSGSNVDASASTTFFDSSTGTEVTVTTQITFSNVASPGETTVTASSNAAGALDSHFAADVASCSISGQPCTTSGECGVGESCDGYHAAFFDVSTTATFSGPVTICGHYPDEEPSPPGGDGIIDGTDIDESRVRLLHRPTGSDVFEDVTSYVDPLTNTVCGEVSSLSPFVVALVPSACNASQPGQAFAAGAKLVLNKINADAVAGNDKLLLKGEFVLPATTSFAAFDPIADGAQLVLTDSSGAVKTAIAVPGGADGGKGTAGWKLNGAGNKWVFTDRTGSPANGLFKLIVRNRSNKAPNRVQVIAKGKNGSYPIASGDEPLGAAVILGDSAAGISGRCGEAAFGAADCAFNGSGTKLTCKY